MQIDKTALTALITRLEEEYGKATPYGEGAYQLISELPRKEDAEFALSLIATAPTLLAALRHFMAVAEELKRALASISHDVEGFVPDSKNTPLAYLMMKDRILRTCDFSIATYQEVIDTPSN